MSFSQYLKKSLGLDWCMTWQNKIKLRWCKTIRLYGTKIETKKINWTIIDEQAN